MADINKGVNTTGSPMSSAGHPASRARSDQSMPNPEAPQRRFGCDRNSRPSDDRMTRAVRTSLSLGPAWAECPMVMFQMVVDKTLDKKIAVVVSFVCTQRQRLIDLFACGLEQMRVQLFGQEFVRQSLVDQDAGGEGWRRLAFHQCRGVVRWPG